MMNTNMDSIVTIPITPVITNTARRIVWMGGGWCPVSCVGHPHTPFLFRNNEYTNNPYPSTVSTRRHLRSSWTTTTIPTARERDERKTKM